MQGALLPDSVDRLDCRGVNGGPAYFARNASCEAWSTTWVFQPSDFGATGQYPAPISIIGGSGGGSKKPGDTVQDGTPFRLHAAHDNNLKPNDLAIERIGCQARTISV